MPGWMIGLKRNVGVRERREESGGYPFLFGRRIFNEAVVQSIQGAQDPHFRPIFPEKNGTKLFTTLQHLCVNIANECKTQRIGIKIHQIIPAYSLV